MGISYYRQYIKNYNKLIQMNDLREYMVQEFVIRVFLQKILPGLDVIPTSIKINDKSSQHDYKKYCGVIGKNGKIITPDLCIARGWNWANSKAKGKNDYRAVVEVKSPVGEWKMTPHKIIEDTVEDKKCRLRKINKIDTIENIKNIKLRNEMSAHVQMNEDKINNKVILTDGISWFFFEGKKVVDQYCLGKRLLKRYKDGNGKIRFTFVGIEWEDVSRVNAIDVSMESVISG